jgi:calcineurin-like phosphoesterase family protein
VPESPPLRRRDLAPLRHLPRSVARNYLRQARDVPPGAAPRRGILGFLGATLPAAIATYARERFGPRHPLADYGAGSGDCGLYPLDGDGDSVRVSLAGDWASGTDEAAAVAAAIGKFQPHFTVHLGDAYYVGDESEIRATFLGERTGPYEPTLWPLGSAGSFALNGNHEMYARGSAYFDVLLPRLGLAAGPPQRASFFCLENAHWRIIALDTAYNSVAWPLLEELPFWPFAASNDLPAAELRWLGHSVRPGADERGIVILTHHSPYRPCGHDCSRIARQLRRHVRRPVLWFFGHEHRLAVYDRHDCGAGLEVWGRNIGHAGMPVEPATQLADPALRLLFTDARRYRNDEGLELGYNGYANLTFTGPILSIEYRDLDGASVYREQWRTAGGALEALEPSGSGPSDALEPEHLDRGAAGRGGGAGGTADERIRRGEH